ncbi:MAG: DNA-3-methyladenine glycosylase [Candidatus Saccharimonadales bacterium]
MSQDFDFLNGPVDEVAPQLLGCELVREIDGYVLRARIVEVEAYDQTDVASHSYRGETERTRVMFGPAGYLYVYFTYGMHYCCNIVVGSKGHGAAVLIRAVEPIEGLDFMKKLRKRDGIDITNGPAKLCQALDIDKSMNGHDLHKSPLKLIINTPLDNDQIVQTTRIGINQAKDVPWRYYIRNNLYVSKP